jgi:hypothetical protein
MGKKRRILLAALLVALLCAFGWWLTRPSEPSYKGKSLSAWLEDYGPPHPDAHEADEAVRHIGTNAIPILLRMLRANDSPLKTKLIEWLGRQHLARIKIASADDKHFDAWAAFQALGENAECAVPEMVQIYEEKISTKSQCVTADSLGGIGPAARVAIPTLLIGLNTTNDPVRRTTIYALGEIHGEPELVVPKLMNLLRDPIPKIRQYAVIALGQFGTNAQSAIPDLAAALNDPDLTIRRAATNALKQIDPTAAARAGIK